jgi:hypothetical protein
VCRSLPGVCCFVLFCLVFPLRCSLVTSLVSFSAVCCIGSFGSLPLLDLSCAIDFFLILCDFERNLLSVS